MPEIHWSQPIPLRSDRTGHLIYTVDTEALPTGAGVYYFGRRSHANLLPLYIGQAGNLQSRITRQLNNVRLMLGIKRSTGRHRRVLVVGELYSARGQAIQRTLDLVERALIEHATLQGYDLVNKQGTRLRHTTIAFSGSRLSRAWTGRTLSVSSRRPRRRRS